jgi:Stage II sporulation protein E (SpoIIE)
MYLDVDVGPPLGVDAPGAAAARSADGWPETAASLDPGSSLILYTDGLLDAYAKLVDDVDLGIGELVEPSPPARPTAPRPAAGSPRSSAARRTCPPTTRPS